MLDTTAMLKELLAERERLEQLIAAVVALNGGAKRRGRPPGSKNRPKAKGDKNGKA